MEKGIITCGLIIRMIFFVINKIIQNMYNGRGKKGND
jgi:hypothetical protein